MPDIANLAGLREPYLPPQPNSGFTFGDLVNLAARTWPARMAKDAYNAFRLPGQVYRGEVSVTGPDGRSNPKVINRSADLAGMVTGGAYAAPGMSGAAGMGIRAYHGSPRNFDKFDLQHAGSVTDEGKLGRGVYFSTDPNVAEKYPHKYEADLNVSNPIEIQLPAWGTEKSAMLKERLGLPETADAADMAAAVKALGHDAVVLDYSPVGYNQKEIAVLDDSLISILRKYGIAGTAAAPAVASQFQEQ